MSELRRLETDYLYTYTDRPALGSGSASTLPMSESAKRKAKKRPLGFTAEIPKRRCPT